MMPARLKMPLMMSVISKTPNTFLTSSKWMRPLSLMVSVGKFRTFVPKMEL